jgi:hypothetical protein
VKIFLFIYLFAHFLSPIQFYAILYFFKCMDRELSDGEIVDSDSEQEVPIQSETVLGNVSFFLQS